MSSKIKVILATLPILIILGILVFASASEAISRHITTPSEDMVSCRPQKSSSADLWTCYDYYGNEFKDLLITQQSI